MPKLIANLNDSLSFINTHFTRGFRCFFQRGFGFGHCHPMAIFDFHHRGRFLNMYKGEKWVDTEINHHSSDMELRL